LESGPYYIEDKELIEKVQRRFTKMINNVKERRGKITLLTAMIIFIYQQLVATQQIKHNNNISK